MTLTIEIPEIASSITEWTYWVKARDNYTCQKCGFHQDDNKGIYAHHAKKNTQLRLVIDNGVTLCSSCHRNTHSPLLSVTNISRRLQLAPDAVIDLLQVGIIKGHQNGDSEWLVTTRDFNHFLSRAMNEYWANSNK